MISDTRYLSYKAAADALGVTRAMIHRYVDDYQIVEKRRVANKRVLTQGDLKKIRRWRETHGAGSAG